MPPASAPASAASTAAAAAGAGASTSGSSPLLVTSGASRANYSNNVSTITAANSSLGPTVMNQAVVGANGKTTYYSGLQSGLAAYQSAMGSAPTTSTTSADGSSTTTSNNSGANNSTTSTSTTTAPANSGASGGSGGSTAAALPAGATGTNENGQPINAQGVIVGPAPTGASQSSNGNYVDSSGNQYTGAPGSAAPVTASTSSSSGTSTGSTDANGNAPGSAGYDGSTDPSSIFYNSGLSPALQEEYQSTIDAQDADIANAQSTLAQAAATMANDPAAAAAVTAIQAQYAALIQAMNLKNQQVLGRASSAAAAFGGLGPMAQSFMSDEMSSAQERLTTIINEEQAAIIKSNQAYQAGDVKAFDDATTALTNAQKAKTTTLTTLLTATQKQVTQTQAQAKIDATTAKNQSSYDQTTATKIAAGMATAISAAGITDPSQITAYVQAMATKNGISNPDILAGALATAQQTAAKTTATVAHTNAETVKTNSTPAAGAAKGGTDANYSYTAADVSAAKSLLQAGGNGYAAMGSDGYSDPGAYTSLMNSWVSLGGTVAGFAKVFPPKTYVNPASYASLPAAIRPKTSAAAAATTYST